MPRARRPDGRTIGQSDSRRKAREPVPGNRLSSFQIVAVELLGRYSNTPSLHKIHRKIIQIEAEKASRAQQSTDTARSHQVQRRLNPDEVRDLIARYQAGATVYELSDRFGCHRNTVSAHLHRAGVPLRNASLTSEQIEIAQVRRQAGLSYAAIAAELHVEPSTVWRALRKAEG